MTTKDMDTKAEALAQQAWADLEEYHHAIRHIGEHGPVVCNPLVGDGWVYTPDLDLIKKMCRVVLGEMALRRSRSGPPPKGLED